MLLFSVLFLSSYLGLCRGQTKPHYKVVTLEAPPLVNQNERGQFEGYAMDILLSLSKTQNFTYEVQVVGDGMYGRLLEDGSWNGMVGELLGGKADMALGALSISADREAVVDFTENIYELVGITILQKKTPKNDWIFEFMVAFKNEVWLALGACMLVTIAVLTIVERLSPYSFLNTQERTQDQEDFRIFSLKESLWFCATTLSPQGGGETPRNLSGRCMVVTYWLFVFIILQTFTANLAAYLTVAKQPKGIQSIQDLTTQSSVEFFIREGTFVESYFRRLAAIEETLYAKWQSRINDPNLPLHPPHWKRPVQKNLGRLWERIQASGMVRSTEEALRRIKDGVGGKAQAYIGDAVEVRHAIESDPDCGLESVGDAFYRQPYAIALPQGSPLRRKFTAEILAMATRLELQELYDKWWLSNDQLRAECKPSTEESVGINLDNFGGSLAVIGGALVLCIPAVLFDSFLYKSQ